MTINLPSGSKERQKEGKEEVSFEDQEDQYHSFSDQEEDRCFSDQEIEKAEITYVYLSDTINS